MKQKGVYSFSMSEKQRLIVGYLVGLTILWFWMALMVSAAGYFKLENPSLFDISNSYWDHFWYNMHALMIAVILVPLIGVYTYRLVIAGNAPLKIVIKVLSATMFYYVCHLSYFMALGNIQQGLLPLEVLARLQFSSWFWGMFFIMTSIVTGVAVGQNQKRQQAERAKFGLDKMLLEMEAKLASEQNDHIRQRLGSHFVLNALSNVIALVRTEQTGRAIDALHLLSDILREVAHADQDAMYSLEEELSFLEKYLAFQQIRFPDLKVKWDIAEGTRRLPLPSHLLQPLVENAFKHGMQADGQLMLSVEAYTENGSMYVQVRNSLSPQKQAVPGGEGQALTALRLEKAYNRPDLFKCSIVDNEYIADLVIPGEDK